MPSTSLTTFFTTLAQVSFTVSGLLAVAIAGDSKRRDYWFGHESRSLFVYISFLLLLLPGFVSIGGLIPSSPTLNNPAWTFITCFLGLLYLMLAITFFFRKKKLVEPEEFERLEKRFSKVNSEMGGFGFATLLVAIIGFIIHYTTSTSNYSLVETWLGVILFLCMVTGAADAVILLRANELTVQSRSELSALSPSEQDSVVKKQASDSGPFFLTILITALISFIIGMFFKHRGD